MTNQRLEHVLAFAKNTLKQAGIDESTQDAFRLVEWYTKTTRLDFIKNPDKEITKDKIAKLAIGLERRIQGEPVHRIIGAREFYGIEFALSDDTLEPRPDTETLVDMVLPHLRNCAATYGCAHFLDIGTGSGAIAVALLAEVKNAKAIAVDISEGALNTACKNALNANVSERFNPLLSNCFGNVTGLFDLIVSNPPYIASQDIETLSREVRNYDPRRALDGGKDGLDFYRVLANDAPRFLKEKALIGVEIGQGQELDVIALFEISGLHLIEQRKDLSGTIRALLFQKY